MNKTVTSEQLYQRKQNFINFLKTIKSDIDYNIRVANSTWTNNAISSAEELLNVLDYYRDELTYYRDTLQNDLDNLTLSDYTDVEEKEVTV